MCVVLLTDLEGPPLLDHAESPEIIDRCVLFLLTDLEGPPLLDHAESLEIIDRCVLFLLTDLEGLPLLDHAESPKIIDSLAAVFCKSPKYSFCTTQMVENFHHCHCMDLLM